MTRAPGRRHPSGPSVSGDAGRASLERSLAGALEAFRHGDLPRARDGCEAVLHADPHHPTALRLCGAVLMRLGAADSAIARFTAALAIDPDNPVDHSNLGGALVAAGRHSEAAPHIARALALRPDYPDAHNFRGKLLAATGDIRGAVESFRRAAAAAPGRADLMVNLGRALVSAGGASEAVSVLRRALAAQPDDVEPRLLLARVALLERNFADAASWVTDARRLRPDDPGVLRLAGQVHLASGEPAAAEACFRAVLDRVPDDVETLCDLGSALFESDAVDDALACFERAIEGDPGLARAHCLAGVARQAAGDIDRAIDCFRAAIAADGDFGEAYRLLALARRVPPGDPVIHDAQAAAARPLGDDDRQHLEFALFKIHDDLGDTGVAFTHLDRGNRLRRAAFTYDVAGDEAFCDRLVATFDAGFFAGRDGWGDAAAAPIFVVGMPRSGTTLVEQILAAHTAVHGAGERRDLDAILWDSPVADRAGPSDWFATMLGFGAADVRSMARRYLAALPPLKPPARRSVDKMPQNFYYVGLIRVLFPNARIVHCVRNPVATCFSCFQNYFEHHLPFAYDLVELGRYHRAYARVMAHWHAMLPGFVHDVRYEHLVDDPEREIRALLAYCGLTEEAACFEPHRVRRTVRTLSVAQVRQPIHTRSVDGWRRYADRLTPLLGALGETP
jgi:tetratricopeptide (TPR) repeat protein